MKFSFGSGRKTCTSWWSRIRTQGFYFVKFSLYSGKFCSPYSRKCFLTMNLGLVSPSHHPSESEEEDSGKLEMSWGTVQTATKPFWQHLKKKQKTQTWRVFWETAWFLKVSQDPETVEQDPEKKTEKKNFGVLFSGILRNFGEFSRIICDKTRKS